MSSSSQRGVFVSRKMVAPVRVPTVVARLALI
jgi:hypothetical protein